MGGLISCFPNLLRHFNLLLWVNYNFMKNRLWFRYINVILHYANTSMQYTAIFHDCKNVNFKMKNYNIFLIFAQNIDCGYTLEPPH